jgi:plastocyanin
MIRRRLVGAAVLLALVATVFAAITPAGHSDDDSGRAHIAILDDCDPRDPLWNNVGGCTLRRGDVTFAEFLGENDSPLAAAVIGHQAWRNEPAYLKIHRGTAVRVRNEGGRPHTFTKVAAFGGGKVPLPPLNEGLQTAPECPGSLDLAPGDSIRLTLAVGNHRFMCCIHPWMRALIKVKAHGEGGIVGDD